MAVCDAVLESSLAPATSLVLAPELEPQKVPEQELELEPAPALAPPPHAAPAAAALCHDRQCLTHHART